MRGHPVTMRALGEWDKEVGVPLQTALAVSMEMSGKTGEQAVARCMIMMAQSARAMTSTAKKNRTVLFDERLHGSQYVEIYSQIKGHKPTRLYKFACGSLANAKDKRALSWDLARKIGNAGMARRSWFWGLRNLPGAPYQMGGKPYRGVARLITLQGRGEMAFGLVLENRLSYILQTIPANYEEMAWRSAGIRIMQDAARKIEKQYMQQLQRLGVRDRNPMSLSARKASFAALAARYEAA